MLELLTDLNIAYPQDFDDDGVASLSGYMGSWVTTNSDSELTLTTVAVQPAYPVWNESSVVGETSRGYTDDVTETGKLTVLVGYHRARTNQYTGTPSVNDILATTSLGVLSTQASPGEGKAIAVCTRSPHAVTYRGTSFTCIEYETLK